MKPAESKSAINPSKITLADVSSVGGGRGLTYELVHSPYVFDATSDKVRIEEYAFFLDNGNPSPIRLARASIVELDGNFNPKGTGDALLQTVAQFKDNKVWVSIFAWHLSEMKRNRPALWGSHPIPVRLNIFVELI